MRDQPLFLLFLFLWFTKLTDPDLEVVGQSRAWVYTHHSQPSLGTVILDLVSSCLHTSWLLCPLFRLPGPLAPASDFGYHHTQLWLCLHLNWKVLWWANNGPVTWEYITLCRGLNCVPPRNPCINVFTLSPAPQNMSVLEIGPLKRWQNDNGVARVGPNLIWLVFSEEEFWTYRDTREVSRRPSKDTAKRWPSNPGRQAPEKPTGGYLGLGFPASRTPRKWLSTV